MTNPTDTPNPTRVIALMNQKGGVGKTTTTVNLAAGIATNNRKTLVIDLDPQAHATLHLGVDPAGDHATVYDLLNGDAAPGEAIQPVNEHLHILPAETDLAAAEQELASADDRNSILRNALAPILGEYEHVLIDCPPSLGLLTMNALTTAREVFIPMQAHFFALQGVGKLLETVGMVTHAVNPSLRVTGIILCMHESQTTLSKEVVQDLEDFLAEARTQDVPWKTARLLKPVVRRNIKLAECPSYGQSIFEYAPESNGAADYRELANRVVREWDHYVSQRLPSHGAAPEVVVTDPYNGASASPDANATAYEHRTA